MGMQGVEIGKSPKGAMAGDAHLSSRTDDLYQPGM